MDTCEKCGHIFKNPENYRRHLSGKCEGLGPRMSRRIGDSLCLYCNKVFNNAENFRRHVYYCEKLVGVDLQEEYNLGVSYEELAEKYEVSLIFIKKNKLINRKLRPKKEKVPKEKIIRERKKPTQHKRYSDELIDEWKTLLLGGLSYEEIAAKFEVSRKTVQRRISMYASYICNLCGGIFINKENYRRHMNRNCEGKGKTVDLRSKGEVCEYCGKFFLNLENLRRHSVVCEKVFGVDLQKEYDEGCSVADLSKKYDVASGFLTGNGHVKVLGDKQECLSVLREKCPSKFFFGSDKKVSYGEELFEKLLDASGLYGEFAIVHQYRRRKYSLDFAFVDIKLDVEIDGSQHVYNKLHVQRDIFRNEFLINLGWTVYRVYSDKLLRNPDKVFNEFLTFLSEYERSPGEPRLVKTYGERDVEFVAKWREERINLILNSGVDFTKRGWVDTVGGIIGIYPSGIVRWMKKNMPEFYETCWNVSSTKVELFGKTEQLEN